MKAAGKAAHSNSLKGSAYFVIRGKKEWQNSLRLFSDYFAVLANILLLIWLLFCISLENRHYLTYM